MATIEPLVDRLPLPPLCEVPRPARTGFYCACGLCVCNTVMIGPQSACWLCRAGDHARSKR